MSGFELNKIVASVLLASLIAMIVGMVANALYKPQLIVDHRGYKVDVVEHEAVAGVGAPVAEQEVNIAELMKSANAELGRDIAKKCLSCHSIDQGQANKVGPHLWNIVGRTKAAVTEYKYSTAMQAKGGAWDEESLFHFLHKPSKFITGTKMSFIGLNKPEDIVNLIAFLKTFVSDKH